MVECLEINNQSNANSSFEKEIKLILKLAVWKLFKVPCLFEKTNVNSSAVTNISQEVWLGGEDFFIESIIFQWAHMATCSMSVL